MLTVEFFNPWMEFILNSLEWKKVVQSSSANLKINCNALKQLCKSLALSTQQQHILKDALSMQRESLSGPLAVRSSSPDEDDAYISLAGGYSTFLGVTIESLESAVAGIFASCFNERVLLYKRKNGIPWDNPGIAVIVQQQLNSEKAGVAFSLNPGNNCFDEVLVNADYGLGESVVSGKITPDTFLTDKVTKRIIKRTAGKKEFSIQLSSDGGVKKSIVNDPEELCLCDKEIMQITELLTRVEFMHIYGFRCPGELDIATPRLYEQPEKLYKNLLVLSENTDNETNPQFIFRKGIEKRQQAYKAMIAETGLFASWLVKKLYPVYVEFAAYREIPKYYSIMLMDMHRKRVLAIADELLESGRIDNWEQVFDLTIRDLDTALIDDKFDLRAKAEKNLGFYKKIKHIKHFPRIIDSRGRILNPPRKEIKDGEISGTPISPGKINGQVKVLHYPDEKPVLKGEILVARATDPGWTPLFLNAAGIILEVGGALQHGALVAREYGKPCVAGIENVTEILKDGEPVELDGTCGIIRVQT